MSVPPVQVRRRSRSGELKRRRRFCSPRGQSGERWKCIRCTSSGMWSTGKRDDSRALACDARIYVSVSVSVSALLHALLTASESSDPVERLHGARGVCRISDRPDIAGNCVVMRSDDRGDSARRQAAPAPNRSRSRTGACAEKRRARCCRGRTRSRSGTAPTHPPSPQPHAPQATRSARYTRSSSAPEREVHGRAYPQHPAP